MMMMTIMMMKALDAQFITYDETDLTDGLDDGNERLVSRKRYHRYWCLEFKFVVV